MRTPAAAPSSPRRPSRRFPGRYFSRGCGRFSALVEPSPLRKMGEREPCRATAEIQIDRWRVWSRLFINLFKLPSKADALRGAIDFAEAQSLQVTAQPP